MRQAVILVTLLLFTPWAAADFSVWQGPNSSPDNADFSPSNSTYNAFTIPTNSTITDANLEILPSWIEAEDNGTVWSANSINGFDFGTSSNTTSLGYSGDLMLTAQSSYGVMTDFESKSLQFESWSTSGEKIWQPINVSNSLCGPSNSTDGNFVAGTCNSTLVPQNTTSTLRSEFWETPAVVRNMTVSFDRWVSLDSDDLVSIEATFDSGNNWTELDNWSGTIEQWEHEEYLLDSLIGLSTTSKIGFRFTISTSNNSSMDEGFFVDSFNFSNDGEPLGAWFHGNQNGQYSTFADGSLIIPLNLSGFSGPLEFKYWSNWDIEGDFNDNLVVMISLDNGTTWTIMSPLPGVPGIGVPVGGLIYTQQSYDWRALQHPFPATAIGHTNSSNALLKFRVTTDGVKHFGGSAIDGWEGIMIDDFAIISTNSGSLLETPINNLTSTTGHYLENVSNYYNDWQYVTWEGHNGPWSTSDSFEINQMLPDGWRIDHASGGTPWEIGSIDNSGNVGPNSIIWPSGSSGMAINLDGTYDHNTFTHLISPTYHIPEDSSAHLTFQHWICTEAAWDGGAVYTSTDEGSTWQYYGENITGFYERYSQVNTFSPFYGHGIFDGSTVANGCGNNNSAHTFQKKSGDISYLAGKDVKIRFSFFSDTYLAEDGWYIDDAGIEIDRFVSNGTWTSPVIDVDEAGWGTLSGLIEVSNETGISIDVLDAFGYEIQGYTNLSLDVKLYLGAWEYDKLQFRVNMWTVNETLTPRMKLLHHGMTTYLNAANVNIPNEYEHLITIHKNGTIENTAFPLSTNIAVISLDWKDWRPYQQVYSICEGDATINLFSPYRELRPLNSSWEQGNPQGYEVTGNCNNGTTLSLLDAKVRPLASIMLSPGQWFNSLKFEPLSLRSPIDIAIDLGANDSNEWSHSGFFSHHMNLTSVFVDGQQVALTDVRGIEIPYQYGFSFSIQSLSNVYPYSPYYWQRIDGCASVIVADIVVQCWYSVQRTQQNITTNGVTQRYLTHTWSQNNLQPGVLKIIGVNIVTDIPYIWDISNEMATQAFNNEIGTNSIMPVRVSSSRGGVEINGTVDYSPTITDEWVSVPNATIIPGRTVIAVSRHSNLLGTADLESVTLVLSTSRNISDIIVEIEIDSFDQGGRFIQKSGAGIASIDSVNSTWDGENATWIITGQWNLDDYPRLYWMVFARNSNGLIAGPAIGVSGSGLYAASTNDLEIVDLKAWSPGKILHDYSDSQWPFNVQRESNIVVNGKVRFSGLEGVHPLPDDVELTVHLLDSLSPHFSKVVPVLADGTFNTSITATGRGNLSGNTMQITASLSRVGPTVISSAIDVTADYLQIPFVLDSVDAEVVSLVVLAPGGPQPADGHVWNPGQDIPLRLFLIDDCGLPTNMTMYYNRSGRGWESLEFFTPAGALEATVDLPLIEESNIPLPDEENGWMEVYFVGRDLAGNPLTGGGDKDQPLAKIHVQTRKATWVGPESLNLDRFDDNLFPGNSHQFQFTLSDDNGLESLDLISFGLIDNQSDTCWFEWVPWSDEIINDASCFIFPPRINATKYPFVNTWDITITFELRWDIAADIGYGINYPWLHIYDEDSRTGKGFDSITPLEWRIHSGIDVIFDEVVDIVGPIGEVVDGILYIQSQDIVVFNLLALHAGTEIPAQNFPYNIQTILRVAGNGTENILVEEINSDGTASIRVVFDEAIYGKEIAITLHMTSLPGQTITGQSLSAIIDKSDPTITLSPGVLASLYSNNLTQIFIELIFIDADGIGNSELTMHWNYIRDGRIIEGAGGQNAIPSTFSTSLNHLHATTVDMSTSSIALQKGDEVIVWFTGKDASGRSLTGQGTTNSQPFQPSFSWIAYEPELGEIISAPYRPTLGQIITIDISVINLGQLDGNSTLILFDLEGKVLGNTSLDIAPGMTATHSFEIEAWATGDLGLKVQLDDQVAVPVPLAGVEDSFDNASGLESNMQSLALLCVLLAGLLLMFANSKRLQMQQFSEEEE